MTGRPSLDALLELNPALANLVEAPSSGLSPAECLGRLPESYFTEFDPEATANHLEQLCSLTVERPFALHVSARANDVAVTVFSFDVEGMLGLLTGVLGVSGFDIQSGSVYTLLRPPAGTTDSRKNNPAQYHRRGNRRTASPPVLPTRRIIDRFAGTLPPGRSLGELESQLNASLGEILPQMLPGGNTEQARRMVNEAVADQLRTDESGSDAALFPVELAFDTSGPVTRMTIAGEDTPFFLYSLSTALTLQGVSIESVRISTEGHLIRDSLELVDRNGKPITDPDKLNRIRLSVLLTKQFTYFLGGAPDPYAALVRFESMSHEIVTAARQEGMAGVLSQPLILKELARLLGTSDFLWEDFIRGQYENLVPMLGEGTAQFSTPPDELEKRLATALAGAPDRDARKAALNAFKDAEAFRIDLDHILQDDRDFYFLSSRLSRLAEIIIRAALDIVWEPLTSRFGTPGTVAGLPATYAVFALGKLGGHAIGYASDLELLFVYSDNGTTDGERSIPNAEFYERFFNEAVACIESKREGIFQVDLRLRPHGKAGPHAVSLESFNRYYGRDGEAHSYERLALTRLRAFAGDEELGKRVEHLRDDFVYASDSISLKDVSSLRERQLKEKASGQRLNAKFSPGGLVDLEYGLQILLVQHGRSNPRLRTPSLHSGLEELARSGLMDSNEAQRLVRAYRFLRNLINGLRMLRGNAQDLFLPETDSLEFAHLARRTGYTRKGGLSAADQLQVEFAARTAAVRAFLEHHLGRDSIPGKPAGTAADLVYSTDLSDDLLASITATAGLRDATRALVNIRSLAGTDSRREVFSELIVLAWASLRDSSDPDMALNNWDRYVGAAADPVAHYVSLLRQPAKLRLMLAVFSGSQFLAEILIGTPAFLEWALDRSVVGSEREGGAMLTDLRNELSDDEDRRAVIRWFRQREILRIGTRDICLGTPIEIITREISALATSVVQADLEQIWHEQDVPLALRERFCLLAFGKLGGRELNYSSDIDLLGVHNGDPANHGSIHATVMETLRADLSSRTEHGYAFRVDFRLRPYGASGPLVPGCESVERYYRETAQPWEHQALLKLSPVAGNLEVGRQLLDSLKEASASKWDRDTVTQSIGRMRAESVRQSLRRGDDVKNGPGGIRDIEFTVQGLQMIHSTDHPNVLTGNTMRAIGLLRDAGIISVETASTLTDDYQLLRRVEHFLQVFEDRQVHSLPEGEIARRALARRIAGPGANSESVFASLAERRRAVREIFDHFIETGEVPVSPLPQAGE